MPIGVLAMHKVGGMKYAGLDEAGVKKYREALKAFNEKAEAGLFANKAEYKAAKDSLNNMLKADVKNPFTKFFKGIGRLINVGNETRAAYKSTAKNNLNFMRKIPNFLKNCLGVPMRFLIPLALVSPFIAKTLTKGVHAIFGRPTHSVLDEDQEDTENEATQQINNAQNAQNGQNPFDWQPIHHSSPTNLVNMRQQGQTYTEPQTQRPKDNYTYIPSPQGVIENKEGRPEQRRTYIPSPEAAKINPEDRTAADQALSRADKAEKLAMEALSMNW